MRTAVIFAAIVALALPTASLAAIDPYKAPAGSGWSLDQAVDAMLYYGPYENTVHVRCTSVGMPTYEAPRGGQYWKRFRCSLRWRQGDSYFDRWGFFRIPPEHVTRGVLRVVSAFPHGWRFSVTYAP